MCLGQGQIEPLPGEWHHVMFEHDSQARVVRRPVFDAWFDAWSCHET